MNINTAWRVWGVSHIIIFALQCHGGHAQLQCHECNEAFKVSWEPRTCQINATAVPSRQCNSEQTFCFVQRVTVKGILTRITRDCTSECRNGCTATSFGITQVTCTSCCDQDNCNTGNHAPPPPFPRPAATTPTILLPCFISLCSLFLTTGSPGGLLDTSFSLH